MAGEIKPLRLKREPVPRAKPVATVENPVAKVLVDTGLLHIDQEFDFLVPQELAEIAVPGVLVKVPFNRKRVLGVIISRHPESEFRGELRFISEAIRPFPLIGANILALTAEVKRYYGGTRWDVIRFALPALSKGSQHLIPAREGKNVRNPGRDSRYPDGFWKALGDLPTNESRIRTWWAPPPYEDPFEFLSALPAYSRSWSLVLLPDAHDVERMVEKLRAHEQYRDSLIVPWHSQLTRAEREQNFLQVLRGKSGIVVGVRGALFLPMSKLDLILLWDEGDDSYAEQRSPYFHAREVAIMRAHLEKAHLIIGGASPSLAAISYIQRRYLNILTPTQSTNSRRTVTVQALSQESDPNSLGRIPSQAWKIIQEGLKSGPVLVQVPQRGYILALTCNTCRNRALCHCGGKLICEGTRKCAECSLCGSLKLDWQCPHCAASQFRFSQVGDLRILEELGRAFPNQALLSTNKDHRVRFVEGSPLIVISTPGAEPIAPAGYSAAVVINSALVLNRSALDAEEEARRRWFGLALLLCSGAPLFIDSEFQNRNIQALQRWDSIGIGVREFEERRALNLPPAVKTISVSGEFEAVAQVVRNLPPECEVSRPKLDGHNESSALVRINAPNPSQYIAEIFLRARTQSARGSSIARIKIDPISI